MKNSLLLMLIVMTMSFVSEKLCAQSVPYVVHVYNPAHPTLNAFKKYGGAAISWYDHMVNVHNDRLTYLDPIVGTKSKYLGEAATCLNFNQSSMELGTLNSDNAEYILAHSVPVIVDVPAGQLFVLGTDPATHTVAGFYNPAYKEVAMLQYTAPNGRKFYVSKYSGADKECCINLVIDLKPREPDAPNVIEKSVHDTVFLTKEVVKEVEVEKLVHDAAVTNNYYDDYNTYNNYNTPQTYYPQNTNYGYGYGGGFSLGLSFVAPSVYQPAPCYQQPAATPAPTVYQTINNSSNTTVEVDNTVFVNNTTIVTNPTTRPPGTNTGGGGDVTTNTGGGGTNANTTVGGGDRPDGTTGNTNTGAGGTGSNNSGGAGKTSFTADNSATRPQTPEHKKEEISSDLKQAMARMNGNEVALAKQDAPKQQEATRSNDVSPALKQEIDHVNGMGVTVTKKEVEAQKTQPQTASRETPAPVERPYTPATTNPDRNTPTVAQAKPLQVRQSTDNVYPGQKEEEARRAQVAAQRDSRTADATPYNRSDRANSQSRDNNLPPQEQRTNQSNARSNANAYDRSRSGYETQTDRNNQRADVQRQRQESYRDQPRESQRYEQPRQAPQRAEQRSQPSGGGGGYSGGGSAPRGGGGNGGGGHQGGGRH